MVSFFFGNVAGKAFKKLTILWCQNFGKPMDFSGLPFTAALKVNLFQDRKSISSNSFWRKLTFLRFSSEMFSNFRGLIKKSELYKPNIMCLAFNRQLCQRFAESMFFRVWQDLFLQRRLVATWSNFNSSTLGRMFKI